jgi:hypothetical protein
MMKLARVRACVLYDATYDDATDPESSGGNTRVRFTFHPSVRSVIISSSQLAACNLQLGRPPYAKCHGNVRCIPDPGFRRCPSNDRPTSSTVPAGIGQLAGSGFGFGFGFGWGISRYRPGFTLPSDRWLYGNACHHRRV